MVGDRYGAVQSVCGKYSMICKLACSDEALSDKRTTDNVVKDILSFNIALVWIQLRGLTLMAYGKQNRHAVHRIETIARFASVLCEAKCDVILLAPASADIWSLPCLTELAKHMHSSTICLCALNIYNLNKQPVLSPFNVLSTLELPSLPCSCDVNTTHAQLNAMSLSGELLSAL